MVAQLLPGCTARRRRSCAGCRRRSAGWADRLAALPRSAPVPRRLVEQAVSLGRDFAGDPATDGVLVHTDAHYGNVLAADREPWLVIDPKPLSGDPHYEPAPLLWNRWEEVVAPRPGFASRSRGAWTPPSRHSASTRTARATGWWCACCARAVDARGRRPGRAHPAPAERDELTTAVAIAKAVQD